MPPSILPPLTLWENTHPTQASIKPKHANNMAFNAFQRTALDTGTKVNSRVEVKPTAFSTMPVTVNKIVQDAVRKLHTEAGMWAEEVSDIVVVLWHVLVRKGLTNRRLVCKFSDSLLCVAVSY